MSVPLNRYASANFSTDCPPAKVSALPSVIELPSFTLKEPGYVVRLQGGYCLLRFLLVYYLPFIVVDHPFAMVDESFFGWRVNICGGHRSAPDARYSVRLPWVLCCRCEPEAVVRDGVVASSGCNMSKFSPACLSVAFVSLVCRFVLSANRFVRFLPRSSTLLRFCARRISRFRLCAVSSFATRRPLRPSLLHVNLHARFFWSISSSSHPHFSPPHHLLFI